MDVPEVSPTLDALVSLAESEVASSKAGVSGDVTEGLLSLNSVASLDVVDVPTLDMEDSLEFGPESQTQIANW